MEIGALGSLGVSVCDAGGEVSGLQELDAPISIVWRGYFLRRGHLSRQPISNQVGATAILTDLSRDALQISRINRNKISYTDD
jgi:hypothetical protein